MPLLASLRAAQGHLLEHRRERAVMNQPAVADHPISRIPNRPLPPCPRCGGNLYRNRDGDYVTVSCLTCGRPVTDRYVPTPLGYEVRLPLRREEITALAHQSLKRPKPKLDVPEPELTGLVERYCDLRRRGFTHGAMRAKTGWPRHFPALLLEEASPAPDVGHAGQPRPSLRGVGAHCPRRRRPPRDHPTDVGLHAAGDQAQTHRCPRRGKRPKPRFTHHPRTRRPPRPSVVDHLRPDDYITAPSTAPSRAATRSATPSNNAAKSSSS